MPYTPARVATPFASLTGVTPMAPFIPGRELSRRFYEEAVRPILSAGFPSLPYAAALIGPGSDVLGYDTVMSTDHDWGPRLALLLRAADSGQADAVHQALCRDLPVTFCGYPVSATSAPGEGTGVRDHRVMVTTLKDFIWNQLRYDVESPLMAADWLTFPAEALLELTAGAVHHDSAGELTEFRQRIAWYPHDVWLYLMAAGWRRIAQEEHLMPRAGYAGDELGSALIGARLVRDCMSLCFLMEKQYAPYPKWFGTAFQRLACAPRLTPGLAHAQHAEGWQEREAALGEVYVALAEMHNVLGLTERLPAALAPFYTRPFRVIQGDRFAAALVEGITDPDVRRIAGRRLIGSIDQWSDSTDLRGVSAWRPTLRELYT